MNKKIIFYVLFILLPLCGMEMEVVEKPYPELPQEIWTKIVAASPEKNNLRCASKSFKKICSIENHNIFCYIPLVLTRKQSIYAFLLATYRKVPETIKNLSSLGIVGVDTETFITANKIKEDLTCNGTIPVTAKKIQQYAAYFGDMETLQKSIEETEKCSKRCLIYAAHNGHENIFALLPSNKLLLSTINGIDKHICNTHGNVCIQRCRLSHRKTQPPLFYAAKNGHLRIVEIIISLPGIDINRPHSIKCNYTPLHIAVENGHIGIVQLLCKKGADIQAIANSPIDDEKSVTPINLAYQHEQWAIHKLLREKSSEKQIQLIQETIDEEKEHKKMLNTDPFGCAII
jgi:hypothetical protein